MDPLSRVARAARAVLVAGRDALSPRAALERAAQRAIHTRSQPLTAGRRVLYLRPKQARGRVALEEGPFDLVQCAGAPDLSESVLDLVLQRLDRGGQMILAVAPDGVEAWRDHLRQRFLHVDSVSVVGATLADLRFEEAGGASAAVLEMLTASAPLHHLPPGPLRLHVGSGSQCLEGWVNVDIRPFPGVDLVADVTRGLEYEGVETVYAEHFLEHLAVDDAIDFLVAVQRMLRPDGRLRLSTPNLDWVWQTHYRLEAASEQKLEAALALNRAFHGWGHQFVWNRETLEQVLTVVGFRNLSWHLHGESDVEIFRGLERHETYGDSEELPHVLIVEALRGEPDVEGLAELRSRFRRELLDHVAGY